MTEWAIYRLADDALGVLPPVFAHAFGQAIELPVLRWKYATGRGESWLASTPEGAPAMHCGLLFRDVSFAGRHARAAQLVDLAAATDKQGLARRNGVFSHLMHHILNGLPRADNPHCIALGFPSERAMRLGEHLGVYHAIDQLYDLRFAVAKKWTGWGLACQPTAALPATAIIDRLWQHMAHELADAAVGVRDASYLNWRFVQHPQNRYQLLVCKGFFGRKIHALLVVRCGDDGVCQLIDALAPPSVLPEALAALEAWCGKQQMQEIHFALTGRFAQQLAPLAQACTASEIRIMANPRTPPDVLAYFRNNWWLTAGDTDYR